jgi:hypothetical protein
MEIAEIVLSYIQVLLNWPFLGACIIFIFLFKFKERIDDFLGRLVRGKVGAFSLEASPVKQEKSIKGNKIKGTKEKAIEFIVNEPEKALNEYLKIHNLYKFEKGFIIIYGTQIKLLEHLAIKADAGEKLINLYKFYNDFTKKAFSFTLSFAQYLEFLESWKFIQTTAHKDNEKIVKMTPHGLEFLSYIKSQYPAMYKTKVF